MNNNQQPREITAEEIAAFRAFDARERRAKTIAGRNPSQMWPSTMHVTGPDGRSAVTWLRELAEAELSSEADAQLAA